MLQILNGPWRHLGSMKWKGVRGFIVFLLLEAVLQGRLFRPTIYPTFNKGFIFFDVTGQSLRKTEQLQFFSCATDSKFVRGASAQCSTWCWHIFVIVPHEQCSLPAGFIFAHGLDDAGRFLFFFSHCFQVRHSHMDVISLHLLFIQPI